MAVSTGTAILGAAGIGAASNLLGGGGKESGSTQATQTSEPWWGVKPYLQDTLYPSAQALLYRGQHLGDQSAQTGQAQNLQAQRALSGSPLNRSAQQNNLATLNGDFLSVNSNPYLRGAVNQALGDVKSQVNAQFAGDNFGNSAHQEWLGRKLADTALPIYAQNYQQERQRQVGAQALAPTLANQDYVDIGQLSQVGQQKDARNQAQMDEQWNALQRFQQLISGAPGGTTTTQQPYFTNPMSNALGMGLGGLGLYNGLNQAGLLGGGGGGMPQEMVAGQYSLMNPQYG